MSYSNGSEWRKWDLHVHSKYSLETRAKLEISEIFQNAISNEISVISITDHTNVDALDEIWEYSDTIINHKGENKKVSDLVTFLPGVELKTDKGNKPIHMIAIFPQTINMGTHIANVDKQFLITEYLSKLECTEHKIKSNGNGDYKKGLLETAVTFEEAASKARELGGIIIIHNGTKENGFDEGMSNPPRDASEQDLLNSLGSKKLELMKDYVDICELPNISAKTNQKAVKFYLKQFNKPCIISSDSHETFDGEKYTWIKADPTYDGLRQILNEPINRICLEDEPEIIERVRANKTKYISNIKIAKEDSSNISDRWFEDITIPLNSELTAIIGNKGNGKSAIVDIIGLLGDSKARGYSFLNKNRFKKRGLASNFKGTITWMSGDKSEKNLDSEVSKEAVPKVNYIPQNYFEELCSNESNAFDLELKKVIFSHINNSDRLGMESLDALISYKSEIVNNDIEKLQVELNKINKGIIDLELLNKDSYKKEIEENIQVKANEIKINEENKPTKILAPEEDKDFIKFSKTRSDEIIKIRKEIEELESKHEDNIDSKKNLLLDVSQLEKTLKSIENVYYNINEVIKDNEGLLEKHNIEIKEVIKFEFHTEKIITKVKTLKEEIEKLDAFLNDQNPTGLSFLKENLKNKILKIEDGLSGPTKEYQKYLGELQKWTTKFNQLVGTKDKIDSLSYYIEKLRYIEEDLKGELKSKLDSRIEVTKKTFEKKNELNEIFKELYSSVTDYIEKYGSLNEKYPIKFDAYLKEVDFIGNFFSYVNRGVGGYYRNVEQSEFSNNIAEIDFSDYVNVIKFVNELISRFNNESKDLHNQIKDGKLLAFYNYIFSLEFLQPNYQLMLQDKSLDELSPGEKGALLLIFYLVIDQELIPLIIDQPEENLDNQSVYEILVPFISFAKKRRQIIIVTHNPNLAVVCDAEEIIRVSIDKHNGNEVKIESGSIENQSINNDIVKILEGTKPAFNNRKAKYRII